MNGTRRIVIVVILGAALACFASQAHASPLTCIVPTSVALDVVPTGCEAILTNGPVTYASVHAGNGDTHNFDVLALQMTDVNNAATSARVSIQGIDHDLTTHVDTAFNLLSPNTFFQTTPTDNSFAVDTGQHTFPIIHFINNFGNGVVLKLNFGEAGPPSQIGLQNVKSAADTTSNPGNFTVSSFFDVFTELSLDGGASWRVANNDFNGDQNGPGSILQLVNVPVPEPGTLALTMLGVASVGARIRRRAQSRSAS